MSTAVHPQLEKLARALESHGIGPADAEPPDSEWLSLARAAVRALMEPDRTMLDKGMTAAEDALDTDWDSGCDGESYNSYTSLRSDAPLSIFQAMLRPLVEGEGE